MANIDIFYLQYDWLSAVSTTSHDSLLLSSYQPMPLLPSVTRVSNIMVSLSLLHGFWSDFCPHSCPVAASSEVTSDSYPPITSPFLILLFFDWSLLNTRPFSKCSIPGFHDVAFLGFPCCSLKGSHNLSWSPLTFTP